MASAGALPQGSTQPADDTPNMRNGLAAVEQAALEKLAPLAPHLEEFWTTIPVSDGWESKCKVVRPKTSSEASGKKHPLIVHWHGGGFAAGSPDMVTRPARDWAEEHNATVVCPSYRFTPEHAWPQGVKDGWDVVSWLSHNAETDAEKRFGNVKLSDGFVIGGVSAGGVQAAVNGAIAALVASDPVAGANLKPAVGKLPNAVTGVFSNTPLLLTEEMLPSLKPEHAKMFTSRSDNRFDANIDTESVMNTLRALKCTDYSSPWFSPINVLLKAGDKKSLAQSFPKTYIQSCGMDPLRDDSVIYERVLRELLEAEGVKGSTKIDLFKEDGHAAFTAVMWPNFSRNPSVEEGTMAGMRWLLST